MQGNKSKIIKSEMDQLKQIVEDTLKVQLMDKSRKVVVVDARMIFSKILRDRGHTLISIGRFLKKDHTTIMNYVDRVVHLLKQDEKMFYSYMVCKDSFLKDREEVIDDIQDKDLHMKIARINRHLDQLIKERQQVLEIDQKNTRFKYIIDVLNKKIPEGREIYIENKIMQMLNE